MSELDRYAALVAAARRVIHDYDHDAIAELRGALNAIDIADGLAGEFERRTP